ncbi:MAG: cytochrome c553 [Halieaceae bacterium]|jgi:cytochrome c553
MKIYSMLLLSLTLSSPWTLAEKAPPEAAVCFACHGMDGNSSNPEWPNLAGQNAEYLTLQISNFRSGVRKNALMAPMIAGLPESAVPAVVAYFSSQETRAAANGNPELVNYGQNVAAYCVSCHGGKGLTANGEWPNLAGQHAPYLRAQLEAYKAQARIHPHMQNAVLGFTDNDLDAVVAYYSQLKP